ncbi:MAG: DNA polymerase Y family protein, partial [Gammaproteobacteria bacterium]|nr:DNA polymerase Y family protein [Gammaproteobacteria bacterium]
MRWLAIHFPLLALESLAPEESGTPLAITGLQGSRQRILMCNKPAAELGVAAGMRPGAARALSARLRLLPRDERRELAALAAVADWSGCFTSQISLDPPWGILLELAGSLRLFGGVRPLLSKLGNGLKELKYSVQLCLAPTPGGAMLLAREGRERLVPDRRMLRRLLAGVPLQRLPLAPAGRDALQSMGLETLGDLLQLPDAALGRRLGPEFTAYLARLLGRLPDPRPQFRPPEHFRRRLELPAEVRSASALLFAARRLILELSGFLGARRAGAQCLQWVLFHGEGRESRFELRLMTPERESGPLQMLLSERLERLILPAPVREVALLVESLEPLPDRPLSLFGESGFGESDASGVTPLLLERLQARLGENALSTIQQVADHRPERAWRRCGPNENNKKGVGVNFPR